MKAKELLAELIKVDPESDISFMMDSGCCGDWLDLEAYEVEATKLSYGDTPAWLRVHFRSVPGYKSCIQAGNTTEADKKYWEKFKKDTK